MSLYYSGDLDANYLAGEYLVMNNPWNYQVVPAGVPWSQNIQVNSVDPVNTIFAWKWPAGDARVKGAPSIWYGYSPWQPLGPNPYRSTTRNLPVRLSEMRAYVATWEVNVIRQADSKWDTMCDIWISSGLPATRDNLTAEVLVMVDHQGEWGWPPAKEVSINGAAWNFYHWEANPPYYMFVSPIGRAYSTLKINSFLDFLIGLGNINPAHYLTLLNFGNEVCYGESQSQVTFKVEIDPPGQWGYFATENVSLSPTQRDAFISNLKSMNSDSQHPQPSHRNHWRYRPDGNAIILSAEFLSNSLNASQLAYALSVALGVDVSLIDYSSEMVSYAGHRTDVITFSYRSTDAVKIYLFGAGSDGWNIANAEVLGYLKQNAVAWGDAVRAK